MVTLQQLQYLVAVDTERNFSRAAEKCFVTQPTLSMQIKKLESEQGVELFDRSKQPLKLTPIGEDLVAQARTVLAEMGLFNDIIAESKSDTVGELHVGIIPTLAPYLVPGFIGNFMERYPAVKLYLTEYKTEDIIARLHNETLDAGILATPLNEARIIERPVFYEKLMCYMSEELAGKFGNRVEIEDILKAKLWVLSEGNCFRNQTFNLCSLEQRDFRDQDFRYESGSIETLMRLVDKEGGSTIIPELATLDLPEEKADRVKFIGNLSPVREISIAVRRKHLKRKLLQLLRTEILKSLPKHVLENDGDQRVEI